jgi:addiction module RelE/StbE family toxin
LVYIIWTDEAINDLRAIKEYLDRVAAPEIAQRFCLALLAAPDRIKRFPQSGQVVPEFREEDIREVLFQDYRIIYQVGDGACYIRTVVHGSRDLQRLLDPKRWR